MGELEDITIKTLKGEILASKYESEVKNRIVVPEDKEKEMIALINEEIFKVIKNTLVNNSSIKPAENKKEVPVPPYVAKKESTVPLPPSSYKKPDDKIEINKIETIKKNENDLYKEHGIEIIPDIPIAKDVGIFNPIKKETLYREEIPTKIEKSEEYIVPSIISTPASDTVEYREAIPNNPMGNIITNKLSGNTTSKTTMSDYSLPKISKINQDELEKSIGEKSINPHDPYHEAI